VFKRFTRTLAIGVVLAASVLGVTANVQALHHSAGAHVVRLADGDPGWPPVL